MCRSGILDKDGRDTGIDPFMASFPHLLDVGIMGHCAHGFIREMHAGWHSMLPERRESGTGRI